MFETKILISYIAICITYSMCRMHYLQTFRTDEEYNNMMDELVSMTGNEKQVLITLVLLQILFAPIAAPFSMLKLIFKNLKNVIK